MEQIRRWLQTVALLLLSLAALVASLQWGAPPAVAAESAAAKVGAEEARPEAACVNLMTQTRETARNAIQGLLDDGKSNIVLHNSASMGVPGIVCGW